MIQTKTALTSILALAPLALGVSQCPIDPTPEPPDTNWYLTCGDPVCQGYQGPFEGVPLCDDQEWGDPCETDGQTCDPQDQCNALMVCAETDPREGPCPISSRKYKHDIHYLAEAELSAIHADLMAAPISTWRYKAEGSNGRTHLGFIIEDMPNSSFAVEANRERVDVYGWASMTVAAMKVQQQQIDALRAEVATLKAQVQTQKQ